MYKRSINMANMAEPPEDAEVAIEDVSYQGCYVFKPNHTDHDIDHRPKKKRKTASSPDTYSSDTEVWPRLCAGAEPAKLAHLREELYQSMWTRQEEALENAINQVDARAAEQVIQYLDIDVDASQNLRVAFIVTSSNGEQQAQLLTQWKALRNDHSKDVLAHVYANQATSLQIALKSLIRSAIETHSGLDTYTAFLARHKRQIPMNFDLELLHKYISSNELGKVVVSMPAVETFNLNVLSELFSVLASWTDRISFVLVIGIATTVDLFESRLSRATMRLLDVETFSLSSQKNTFYDIITTVETDPEANIFLGPSIVSTLYEMIQDQSTTANSFIKALKYACMSHFFANPLTTLLSTSLRNQEDASDQADRALAQSIRHTPSFQAYHASLLDSGDPYDLITARSLLENDTELLRVSSDLLQTSTLAHYRRQARSLHALTQICCYLNPKLDHFECYRDLVLDFHHNTLLESDHFDNAISLLSAISFSSLQELLSSDLISPLEIESTSSSGDLSRILRKLVTTLSTKAPPSSLYLYEACVYNLRTPLQTTMNPRSRFAIERALSTPSDYLGCECCSSTDSASREPTATLYTLLLEAGKDINVMDLWSTFLSAMSPAPGPIPSTPKKSISKATPKSNKAKGKTRPKGADTGENEADDADLEKKEAEHERAVLALFYRALAELQYMGLVKSNSDRRLGKGVDVLAKVTWKGL